MLNHAASVNKKRMDARLEADRKKEAEPETVELQKHDSKEWADYYNDWN